MPFFSRLLRRSLPLLKAALLALVFGPVILLVLYRVVPPPITPLMVIRLFEGEGINKEWTPLEEMQPSLPKLVIAAEDNTFCSHWGFDLEAYQAQLEKSLKGRTSSPACGCFAQPAPVVGIQADRLYSKPREPISPACRPIGPRLRRLHHAVTRSIFLN